MGILHIEMCAHRNVFYLADSWLKKKKKIKSSLITGRKSTDVKDSLSHWSKKEEKKNNPTN